MKEHYKQSVIFFVNKYRHFSLYACIILLALAVAVFPFSYAYINIKVPINILYAALVLFLLFNIRQLVNIKEIALPLIFMAVVVCMAYVSVFFAAHPDITRTAIRQFLLEPTLFMILTFLIIKTLDSRQLKVLLFLLCLAFFYHPLMTIYDFYINGGGKLGYRAMMPGYHVPQTVYVFYLLFALSFAYMGFLKSRGLLKIIFLFFMLASIYAFICNGGRFGVLACIVVLCSPMVFFTYKYKKATLIGLFFLLSVVILWLYYASANWLPRYNFHSMSNHFLQVWAAPPAEMGKFGSGICERGVYCSIHSLGKSSNIVIEDSALERISMLKSTILAIIDNPFRPNGYLFGEFPYNIQNIFPIDSINHPFSLKKDWRGNVIAGHAHNHNYILSVWFELGFFGFVGFALFVGYFIIKFYKQHISFSTKDDVGHIYIASIGAAIIGLILSNMFDCIPVRDGQFVLFIMCGIMLAICSKTYKKSKAKA